MTIQKTIGCKQIFGIGIMVICGAIFIWGCNNAAGPVTSGGAAGNVNIKTLLPQAEQIVQQALSDNNPRVRANAVEVVADTGQAKFAPVLQKLLNDEFVPVRFAAAQGLGDLKYVPAKEAIEKSLTDTDENVRIAAAYALSRLKSPQGLNTVKEAVKNKNQTVRANALVLLGKSGDKNNTELIYWALRDADSDYKVRFQALEALAMLGDEEIYRKLWAMLISYYADDRVMAVRALGALGTSKARDMLLTKLDDEIVEVRLAVAEQLGMLGDKSGEMQVLDVFRKNLTNGMEVEEAERVNVLAALAIGSVGGDSLTLYLPGLLKNDSKFVRMAAAKAVFQLTARE